MTCLELSTEEGEDGGRGQEGEMTQIMYSHVNKIIIIIIKKPVKSLSALVELHH
jgi:hypothetical protein